MSTDFLTSVAAVLSANLITVGFVAALVHAQKRPGFNLPFVVWAGLLLPLIFIALTMIATGPPAPHAG